MIDDTQLIKEINLLLGANKTKSPNNAIPRATECTQNDKNERKIKQEMLDSHLDEDGPYADTVITIYLEDRSLTQEQQTLKEIHEQKSSADKKTSKSPSKIPLKISTEETKLFPFNSAKKSKRHIIIRHQKLCI